MTHTALLAGLLCGVMAAPAAAAGTFTFMSNQGLSAGNAYASAGSHYYVYQVRTSSDHTSCPGVASGYGGYTSTLNGGGNFTSYSQCGTYGGTWFPNGTQSYSFHGAAVNPNVSTFDYIYSGYYEWLGA